MATIAGTGVSINAPGGFTWAGSGAYLY